MISMIFQQSCDSDNLCLYWSVFCHCIFIYSAYPLKIIIFFALWRFALHLLITVAEWYETINQFNQSLRSSTLLATSLHQPLRKSCHWCWSWYFKLKTSVAFDGLNITPMQLTYSLTADLHESSMKYTMVIIEGTNLTFKQI